SSVLRFFDQNAWSFFHAGRVLSRGWQRCSAVALKRWDGEIDWSSPGVGWKTADRRADMKSTFLILRTTSLDWMNWSLKSTNSSALIFNFLTLNQRDLDFEKFSMKTYGVF